MDRIGWMSDLILLQGLEICYVLPFLFVVWQDIISLYQTDSKYFRLSSDGLSLARSPVCAVCVGSNPYPETFMAPRLALWHFTRNGAVRPQIKLDRLQCIWRHGWHNCLLTYLLTQRRTASTPTSVCLLLRHDSARRLWWPWTITSLVRGVQSRERLNWF